MSIFTILTCAMLTLVLGSSALALTREGLLDRDWSDRRLATKRPLRHRA